METYFKKKSVGIFLYFCAFVIKRYVIKESSVITSDDYMSFISYLKKGSSKNVKHCNTEGGG